MTLAPAPSPRDDVRPIVPKLVELTESVPGGDIWERPGLADRDEGGADRHGHLRGARVIAAARRRP